MLAAAVAAHDARASQVVPPYEEDRYDVDDEDEDQYEDDDFDTGYEGATPPRAPSGGRSSGSDLLTLEEEEYENQNGSDPLDWVPVTDAFTMATTPVDVFGTYRILTDVQAAGVSSFSSRDAVMLYLARPRPGEAGYASPASMEVDTDSLRTDEDFRALTEVWQSEGVGVALNDAFMVQHQFEVWRAYNESTVRREAEEYRAISARQGALLATTPFEVTPFVEEESTIHIPFSSTTEGPGAPVDGLDVFARLTLSRDVPFARWVPPTGAAGGMPYLTAGPRGGPMTPTQLITAALPRGEGVDSMNTRPTKVYSLLPEMPSANFNASIQLPDLQMVEEEEAATGGAAIVLAVFAGRDLPRNREDNERELAQYSVKDRFVIAVLKLEAVAPVGQKLRGYISFRSDSESMPRIAARVTALLWNSGRIDVAAARRTRLSGSLTLRGAGEPDELALLMLTTLDPTFRAYFYIEESSYLQSDKKRMTIQFRGAARVASGSDDDAQGRSILSATLLRDGVVNPGDLRIRVARARVESVIHTFSRTFSRFMRIVQQQAPRVRAVAAAALGHPLTTGLVVTSMDAVADEPGQATRQQQTPAARSSAARAPRRRIQELGEAAPDVFVRDYARKCQKYKPKIVSEEEARQWRARGRQVMEYPPPHWEPKPQGGPLLLVCDDDDSPYPGVSQSNLENADKFPYYACCFTRDQRALPKSWYNVWYHGADPDDRASRAHVIVTEKRLAPGRLGSLSAPVLALLGMHHDGQPVGFVRMGVEEDDVNSLVHAALVATRNLEYMGLRTPEERVAFASAVRRRWIESHRAELMAQERVGLPAVPQEGERLDAATCFRLVEEEYGINLFVIEGNTRLQIPRHVQFHVRPARIDRPSLLLSTSGRGAGYEIVVALRPGTTNRPWLEDSAAFPRGGALLGPSLTRRLFTASAYTHFYGTWWTDDGGVVHSARGNPESALDAARLAGSDFPVVAQVLDTTGHCRAVVGEDGSFYEFWPTQPLDLEALPRDAVPGADAASSAQQRASPPPRVDRARRRVSETATTVSTIAGEGARALPFELRPWTLDRVIARHGASPSALDVHEGALVGLWYTIDGDVFDPTRSVFVPCQSVTPVPDNLLQATSARAPSPLRTAFTTSEGAASIEGALSPASLGRMKRALYITSQWVLWLWIRARERGSTETPSQFLDRLATVDTSRIGSDESQFYDLPRVRTFPPLDPSIDPDERDALSAAADWFPTLVVSRSRTQFAIRVPSSVFQRKLGGYLDRVARAHSWESLERRRFVRGLVDEEYLSSPGSTLFMSRRTFLHWFAEQHRRYLAISSNDLEAIPSVYSPQSILAVRSLRKGMVENSTLPIALQVGDLPEELAGRVVLIQNVVTGDILRALGVALAWQTTGRNPGFRAPPIERVHDRELPAYTLLEPLPDGVLAPVESNAQGDEARCWLLRIRQRAMFWYAAVLPLP